MKWLLIRLIFNNPDSKSQQTLAMKTFNWITPMIEKSGYSWRLTKDELA